MELLLVNILTFLGSVLGFATVVYLIAVAKRDNSVMDIAYGPAFLVGTLALWWSTPAPSLTATVILAAITLWSLRLSLRILRKNWGKPEDARYAAWRNAWMARGAWYFYLRSYLQINLLQGIIVSIVALPAIVAFSTPVVSTPALVLGFCVFVFGLAYESLADWQLDRFLARKRAGTEPAPLMTTGLFRYSRRPNYFGESCIWWGLAITVLPLPYGWAALFGPLLITYIVTRVTGPMLERIFLEKFPTEYHAYMATTNYFIPGPPRKHS